VTTRPYDRVTARRLRRHLAAETPAQAHQRAVTAILRVWALDDAIGLTDSNVRRDYDAEARLNVLIDAVAAKVQREEAER